MNEAQIDQFRQRMRLDLLERLVLRTALAAPVLARALSTTESKTLLEGWLDETSRIAQAAYGAHFREPGQTALFSEEVAELIGRMKGVLDTDATELQLFLAAYPPGRLS